MHLTVTYMSCIRAITVNIAGTTFKPSVKKAHKEVEFAPTNLHLQRMMVYNSDRDAGGFFVHHFSVFRLLLLIV